MTGDQKIASVISALVPVAEALIAGGGLPAIEGTVEDFVREFAQSACNDLQVSLSKAASNAAAGLAHAA